MSSTENKPSQNLLPFYKRFYIYQKERFPFLAHGILILCFSFSATSYSRICRHESGFIALPIFFAGVFTTLTLFFLVRIFDEFKDAEDDAMYRKSLPVPRGLMKLSELKIAGIITGVIQLIVNLYFFPKMLLFYGIVMLYLSLMGKEFFVPKWLKAHQGIYIISHMFIIPLIDMYASGLDWYLGGAEAPAGLLFFFCVSYMNGIVLEFGRKIRAPEKEENGVITYSGLYGANKATWLWILWLFVTLAFSIAASWYAGYGIYAYMTLAGFFILCALPGILFMKNKSVKLSKMIEYSSALWTIAMYLTLGGAPMIGKLFF